MKDLNKKLISLIREYGDDRTAALNSCVDLDCFIDVYKRQRWIYLTI